MAINKIKSAMPRNPLRNATISLKPGNGHVVNMSKKENPTGGKVKTRGGKVQKLVSPKANEIVTKGL